MTARLVPAFDRGRPDASGQCLEATILLLGLAGLLSGQTCESLPGRGAQLHPTVAFDGRTFLIAWDDWTRSEESDICGTRLRRSDTLVDTVPFRISRASGNQIAPAVACAPGAFQVVWEDWRDHTPAIYFARVMSDGQMADSNGIAVSRGPNSAMSPALAVGATNSMVVWQETPVGTPSYVSGARISRSGQLLDSTPIRMSWQSGWQGHPRVAYNDYRCIYTVVWENHSGDAESSAVFAARVAEVGVLLDSTAVRVCTSASNQTDPCVAAWGSQSIYCVTWTDGRLESLAVCMTILDSLLQPWDASGVVVETSQYGQHEPFVAKDDVTWFAFSLVWAERDQSGRSGVPFVQVYRDGRLSGPLGWSSCERDLVMPTYTKGYHIREGTLGKLVAVGLDHDSLSPPRLYHDFTWLLNVAEQPGAARQQRPALRPTYVRGILDLDQGTRCRGTEKPSTLLDPNGRVLLTLRPGPNDLSHLAPGVYFVRERSSVGSQHAGQPAVRKVVMTR